MKYIPLSGGVNLQADAHTRQPPGGPLYSARMLASRKPSVLTSISVDLLVLLLYSNCRVAGVIHKIFMRIISVEYGFGENWFLETLGTA